MGDYLNPGTDNFEMSLDSEIYVDKSNLIVKTNRLIRTKQRFICISRPRRFGKTMAAEMLSAYYGEGEDAHELFKDLNIASHSSYEKHLNKYNVLMINMQEFLSNAETVKEMIKDFEATVIDELVEKYPEAEYRNKNKFIQVMRDTYRQTKRPFVILIDEWDCLFREYKNDLDSQKKYLEFLRDWLKDKSYVGLAYMTGILPIKKYGSHSALNMFREYSMTLPRDFVDYFGFKEKEVKELATQYNMDFEKIEKWYNGYFSEINNPIYNPTSVSECLSSKLVASYWNKTETYEALKDYVKLDYDGLKSKITHMFTGTSIKINADKFTNDMTTFSTADDVLTLLVHLGYLTYNFDDSTVRIPNEEVRKEFINAMESLKWNHVIDAIHTSDKLLQAVYDRDDVAVAKGIEKIHEQNTSILKYNDENSLSCVISLAFFSAKDYYYIHRELHSGKGFADLVFIPRKSHLDKPAIVVELKWDKSAEGAISQIKQKNYVSVLEEYQGNILLVGINYDKTEKSNTCVIESLDKLIKNKCPKKAFSS